jgi:thiamine kinase-like enzyme
LSVEKLKQHAQQFDAALNAATFRTFVHGDAKLENFCFANGGGVSAVDFQYVGGGAGIKDLAYFLGSCLTPSECESNVGRHLNTYFELLERALAARGSRVDFPALEREWRALFPVAWADFYRFLLGWAKDAYPFDAYSRKLTDQAIAFVSEGARN